MLALSAVRHKIASLGRYKNGGYDCQEHREQRLLWSSVVVACVHQVLANIGLRFASSRDPGKYDIACRGRRGSEC
jgi:hypothetical protein